MSKKMTAPGYEKLALVLRAAYAQASSGKGKERHAVADVAFEDQPMSVINRQLGSIDGFLYQAHKKSLECKRLPLPRAQDELLGAINYLAGAWIELDRLRRLVPTAVPGRGGWIPWSGGACPTQADRIIRVVLLDGSVSNPSAAGDFEWGWLAEDSDNNIVEYRLATMAECHGF